MERESHAERNELDLLLAIKGINQNYLEEID